MGSIGSSGMDVSGSGSVCSLLVSGCLVGGARRWIVHVIKASASRLLCAWGAHTGVVRAVNCRWVVDIVVTSARIVHTLLVSCARIDRAMRRIVHIVIVCASGLLSARVADARVLRAVVHAWTGIHFAYKFDNIFVSVGFVA